MRNSGDRAKERFQSDLKTKLDPYKEVLASANIQCDLERKIQTLEQELATAQEQVKNTRLSCDNWRTQVITLTADAVKLREWVEREAQAKCDKQRRINTLAADLESEKTERKRWHNETLRMRAKLAEVGK